MRIAVVDAIGHMTHIMSREKLEEQLPKLLPGVTSLYRKHAEHYLITQVHPTLSSTLKLHAERYLVIQVTHF